MIWIAPTEKDHHSAALEKRLWDSADQFRANSGRKAQEYSGPILGIIFLRFAEVRHPAQIGFIANVVRLCRGEETRVHTRRRQRQAKLPRPVLRGFVAPMAEQINALQRQIQNLHRTGDLLLPVCCRGRST